MAPGFGVVGTDWDGERGSLAVVSRIVDTSSPVLLAGVPADALGGAWARLGGR